MLTWVLLEQQQCLQFIWLGCVDGRSIGFTSFVTTARAAREVFPGCVLLWLTSSCSLFTHFFFVTQPLLYTGGSQAVFFFLRGDELLS